MANSPQREAFLKRIKVDQSTTQSNKSTKQGQFSSGNKNSSNKASAPNRGRSKDGGRGNER